jgi:hypothetical protein
MGVCCPPECWASSDFSPCARHGLYENSELEENVKIGSAQMPVVGRFTAHYPDARPVANLS